MWKYKAKRFIPRTLLHGNYENKHNRIDDRFVYLPRIIYSSQPCSILGAYKSTRACSNNLEQGIFPRGFRAKWRWLKRKGRAVMQEFTKETYMRYMLNGVDLFTFDLFSYYSSIITLLYTYRSDMRLTPNMSRLLASYNLGWCLTAIVKPKPKWQLLLSNQNKRGKQRNVQPAPSAVKHAIGAKRWKTCTQYVPNAGKHGTDAISAGKRATVANCW